MKIKKLIITAGIAFICSGCTATKQMALHKMDQIDTTRESVVLLTVKLDNLSVPKYKPYARRSRVWKTDAHKIKKYNVDMKQSVLDTPKDAPKEYLVSVQLPPGEYNLRDIMGTSGVFPIHGTFIVPVYSDFMVYPEEVVYIGHIEAVVVERDGDEHLRAGPVLPLLDQSVTGFGGGTFQITISDNFSLDINRFKERYPVLDNTDIANRVMPDWNKPSSELLSGDIYK